MGTAVSQVASFRDPAGRLLQREGRMLRLVAEEGLENAHFFLRSPVVRALREAGRVVGADELLSWETAGMELGDAALVHAEKDAGRYEQHKPFLSGGIWRNFFSRYPESNWMHKRMLG